MKLIFSKNEHNEIDLKFQNGTIIEDFSYIEMVSQLLDRNTFEDTEYKDITDGEKEKLTQLLKRITDIFKPEDITLDSATQ